jgi:hypothetical protein
MENPSAEGSGISKGAMYTVIWVACGISTLVVGLRLYSQILIVRKPAADDLIIFAAWVSTRQEQSVNESLISQKKLTVESTRLVKRLLQR